MASRKSKRVYLAKEAIRKKLRPDLVRKMDRTMLAFIARRKTVAMTRTKIILFRRL